MEQSKQLTVTLERKMQLKEHSPFRSTQGGKISWWFYHVKKKCTITLFERYNHMIFFPTWWNWHAVGLNIQRHATSSFVHYASFHSDEAPVSESYRLCKETQISMCSFFQLEKNNKPFSTIIGCFFALLNFFISIYDK